MGSVAGTWQTQRPHIQLAKYAEEECDTVDY